MKSEHFWIRKLALGVHFVLFGVMFMWAAGSCPATFMLGSTTGWGTVALISYLVLSMASLPLCNHYASWFMKNIEGEI